MFTPFVMPAKTANQCLPSIITIIQACAENKTHKMFVLKYVMPIFSSWHYRKNPRLLKMAFSNICMLLLPKKTRVYYKPSYYNI